MPSNSSKGIPRRTLAEFVFMYEREPELVDFFVEGRSDKVFIEHVMDGVSRSLRVWEIDDVEMPRDLVESIGEDVGAKGRVMALAEEFDQNLPKDKNFSVLCVVDADTDRLLASAEEGASRFLRRTDFSCIESYYWDEESIAKYLRLSLHGSVPLNANQVMSRLEGLLRETFLLRAAVKSLGLQFEWINPVSCCGDARKGGVFDRDLYLEKILNKNAAFKMREEIQAKVAELREAVDPDVRHSIHGHDLCKAMAWLIKPYLREGGLYSEEVISRSLACCVETLLVIQYPLFSAISTLIPPMKQVN
ncbi:DUF4435 domain-containing protein [Streptomyces sp. SAS_276]|uniref:DUF4435 domain-containing protein n=1 Tax=Streptomyces sp. SAS_276 TaxID=3412745 RepID=UPI00403C9532